MTVPFSAMIAKGVITFTHYDGRSITVQQDQIGYQKVDKLVREVAGDPDNLTLRDQLFEAATPIKTIIRQTEGRVTVDDDEVLFDGTKVHTVVADRILWMLREGFDARPMMHFLERLMSNPSYRAMEQLYRFMEANRIGITSDGMILAYKKVLNNYLDIRTESLSNHVGATVEMPRNQVCDDPKIVCAPGLHVCASQYLDKYGRSAGATRVVICCIDPADVVSIPIDYNNAKMRVCRYKVVSELVAEGHDILATAPVFAGPYAGVVSKSHFTENILRILSDQIGHPVGLEDRLGDHLSAFERSQLAARIEQQYPNSDLMSEPLYGSEMTVKGLIDYIDFTA